METLNLSNGLKVIYEQNKASRVTSIQIWVNCGSVDEKANENGISHFIEHILFKGTKNHQLGGVADAIEKLGGELNAFTSKDYTCYYATVPSLYYKEATQVLRDLVFNPLMDDKDIEDEREVILEEIRRYQDIPSSVASDMFYELQFKDHSYGKPIQGYENVFRNIKVEDVKNYYNRFYSPSNALVVLSGDVQEKEALKELSLIFGEIPPRKFSKEIIEQTSFITETDCSSVELDIKEAVLYFGFSISSLTGKDVPALDILSNILGQSESSRLIKKLRVEKGLVTSISTSSYTPKHGGTFVFGFSFDGEPSKIKSTVDNILKEIFKELVLLKAKGITPEELTRAKNITLSEKVYERRTVDGMASRIGRLVCVTGGTEFEDKYIESIKNVSAQDVIKVFNNYIIGKPASISATIPLKSNVSKQDIIYMFKDNMNNLFSSSSVKGTDTSADGSTWNIDLTAPFLESEPYLIKHKTGARTILKRFSSVPLCSLYICMPGGVSFEKDQTNGISNLTSRNLVYGAGNLSYDQITSKMDSTASFFDIFSGRDGFGASLIVLKPYFKEILEIVKTILTQPKFDKKYFGIEKKILEDEIRSAQDNLSSYTHSLFLKTIYNKSQYRLDPAGSLASVKNLSAKDVSDFYSGILDPKEMVISFAGAFEEDEAIAWSNELVDEINNKNKIQAQSIIEPEQTSPRHLSVTKDTKQAHLIFGYRTCDILDEDVNTLKVLAGVLLGQSGRLFVNLRDKQSLAYSVFPMQMFAKHAGYFAVYIATEHAKVEKAVSEIRKEIDDLKQTLVTEEELKRAKNYLIGLKEIELQTSCAQALNMGLYEFYGHGFKRAFNYSENIMSVSKQDIQRVAVKYFKEDKENLVILTK